VREVDTHPAVQLIEPTGNPCPPRAAPNGIRDQALTNNTEMSVREVDTHPAVQLIEPTGNPCPPRAAPNGIRDQA
ncbi:hypothetical protein ACNQS2_11420, partial [Corynebacterium diphtheriae]